MTTSLTKPYVFGALPFSTVTGKYILRTGCQNRTSRLINRHYAHSTFTRFPGKPASPLITPPSKPKPLRWILGGVTVSIATGYISYSSIKGSSDPYSNEPLIVPEDVSDRYNETAKRFDSEVGLQEALMGLGWLRWWLTRMSTGNVLEVSVGTGRNSNYYRLGRCQSISMIDQSPEMIEIARAKFKKEHPGYKYCRFVTQSGLDPIIAPHGGFDTVIQTMGLCSTPNPVLLLRQMGSVCNPDTGRILLLEHGRSHYDWLNNILDSGATHHADKHGCWWNKDIGRIVEESGLEIIKLKRYHFGTTWWIELKPKSR